MLEDKKSFEVVYKAAARDHRKLAISYFLLKFFNQALRSVLAVMRIQIHQPLPDIQGVKFFLKVQKNFIQS